MALLIDWSPTSGKRMSETSRCEFLLLVMFLLLAFFVAFSGPSPSLEKLRLQDVKKHRQRRKTGGKDKDEKEEKSMKQECSSKMFDEHFFAFFIENTGEVWVLKSGARPNGDASAKKQCFAFFLFFFWLNFPKSFWEKIRISLDSLGGSQRQLWIKIRPLFCSLLFCDVFGPFT